MSLGAALLCSAERKNNSSLNGKPITGRILESRRALFDNFPFLMSLGVLSSTAAVTNDHKLCGLKHKFVILQFWGSGAPHRSHWAKRKVSTKLCSFLEVLAVNLFPCLFQLLEANSVLWLVAFPSIFKASGGGSISPPVISL